MRHVPNRLLAAALLAWAMPAVAGRKVPARQLEAQVDSALVTFIRQRHWEGSAATSHVFLDRQPLGVLDNGTSFVARVPPGRHLLWNLPSQANADLDSCGDACDTAPGNPASGC